MSDRKIVVQSICDEIRNGLTLADILKRKGMPSRQTLHNWMKHDAILRGIYQDARDAAQKASEVTADQIGTLIFGLRNDKTLAELLAELNITKNELVKALVKYPELKEKYLMALETGNRNGFSTEQFKNNILKYIEAGESLTKVCKHKDTPSIRIAYKYINNDSKFRDRYYAAMIKSGRSYTGPKDIAKLFEKRG